jgi:hypothetical protein
MEVGGLANLFTLQYSRADVVIHVTTVTLLGELNGSWLIRFAIVDQGPGLGQQASSTVCTLPCAPCADHPDTLHTGA